MNYKLVISELAAYDLVTIGNYIKNELLNPEAAERIYFKIRSKIDNLVYFSEIFQEIIVHSRKYRRMPVEKYNVFYLINKKSKTITIVRVLYTGIDISKVAM